MSHPPTGPDGPTPADPTQPLTPPGEQAYTIPTGSISPAAGSPYEVPPTPPAAAPPPVPPPVAQPPTAPAAAQPVVPQPPAYHPGSAAVPTPGGQPDHPDGSAYPASTPPFGGAAGSPAGGVGVPHQSSYPVDPMSGPPLSGAPMLGAPYGSPMAAPSRKRPTVLVLAIVAGLLLVFSGVMTTLFLTKSSELNDTRRTLTAQVAERDATIEAQGSEIEKLKRDLDTAKGKIDDIQQDLEGTENQRAELERQKQVISKCLDLLGDAGSAANRGDRAAYEKAIKEAEKVCDEADRYL